MCRTTYFKKELFMFKRWRSKEDDKNWLNRINKMLWLVAHAIKQLWPIHEAYFLSKISARVLLYRHRCFIAWAIDRKLGLKWGQNIRNVITLNKCDQIRQNFATLAKYQISWPITFWGLVKNWQKYIILGKFSLLKMAKYWTPNNLAIWSHWTVATNRHRV